MASVMSRKHPSKKAYPASDGRPMASTDRHRDLMGTLINILHAFFVGDLMVYVSGNLLIYYVPGDKRRHVSPDVFVVFGVAKRERLNYLVWEEGKGPDVAIELTSSSTRREDLETKFRLYRDVLRVREYFLFDPFGDYLDPVFQGYRLRKGEYVPIRPVQGRLPSQVLGLHLEKHGKELKLYNPATGLWLPTPEERIALSEEQIALAEMENQQLRRKLKELRRQLSQQS
jgi:Uma2 family endonuclease